MKIVNTGNIGPREAQRNSDSKLLKNISKNVKKVLNLVSLDAFDNKVVWKSTPNLKTYIETDGNGNFRNPSDKSIIMPKRNSKKQKESVYRFKDELGNKRVISLQKFVALIYHTNLVGSFQTRTVNGDPNDLSKSNVKWVTENVIY